METISTTKARSDFAETINHVAYSKERVILERRGKSFVAIIPIEDLELLEEYEDKMDLKEALKRLNSNEGTVEWTQVKEKLKHTK